MLAGFLFVVLPVEDIPLAPAWRYATRQRGDLPTDYGIDPRIGFVILFEHLFDLGQHQALIFDLGQPFLAQHLHDEVREIGFSTLAEAHAATS